MHTQLLARRDKFDAIYIPVIEFTAYFENYIEKRELPISDNLSVKENSSTKRQAGEKEVDETRTIVLASPSKLYEISVFNVTMDTTIQQLNTRFRSNSLLKEIAWLSPTCFNEITQLEKLSEETLEFFAELATVEKADFVKKLCPFAIHFVD